MRTRDVLLLAACILAVTAIVLTLALVGTREVTGWAATAARAALGSSAVGLMLAGAAVLFLGSLAARAWAIADDAAQAARVRADEKARRDAALLRRMAADPSSFLDDSRGPQPETFRASCGELVRIPETKSDSGHIAPRDAA